MSATKVLKDAKNLLESVGWVKGTFFKVSYPNSWDRGIEVGYCSVGALQKIDGPHEAEACIRLARAVSPFVKTVRGKRAVSAFNKEPHARQAKTLIIRWNDSRVTKKADVLAAFDAAIGDSNDSD